VLAGPAVTFFGTSGLPKTTLYGSSFLGFPV
jgi:hypothetical protein